MRPEGTRGPGRGLTWALSLSITSPKEMRLTPVLTQESGVRSLAGCSRTTVWVSGPFPGAHRAVTFTLCQELLA